MIWLRVQRASGAKRPSPTPEVTPFSTAHWTAPA